jgi:hypothetical protein
MNKTTLTHRFVKGLHLFFIAALLLVSAASLALSAIQPQPAQAAPSTWTATGNLNSGRLYHTATLLPDGKVLTAGGWGPGGVLNSAELYDRGLGFLDAWRPVLTNVTSPLLLGNPLSASGSRFQGISETSGGNTYQNSSTNYPLMQLRRLDNEQMRFLLPDPATGWTDISFTSVPVTGFAPGHALVTIFTNAIPSVSRIIQVTELGTIVIEKVTDPASGTDFTDDIEAPNSFTLDDSGLPKIFNDVLPGTYTVTEDDPTPDFDLTGLVCVEDVNSNSVTDLPTRQATIYLNPGETVTCTFTNGVPPVPIGGIVVPVNKLGLLSPWLGLATLVSLAALMVALVRRRKTITK